MITPEDLPHRALWRRSTGENQRGDRMYSDPVEILCRVERRTRFESGEGATPYTRINVGSEHLADVGDRISLVLEDPEESDWENVDDFADQVDIDGEVVGRICYLESGRL